jgi:hypothetical protein
LRYKIASGGGGIGTISWCYLKCIWLTVCITSAGLLMFINDALRAVTDIPRLIILSCFLFFISDGRILLSRELAFSQSLANIENVSRAGLSGSGQRSSASCAERHYPERDNLPLKISPSVVPKAQAILWIRNAKTRIRATRATAVYFSKHSPHPLLERARARVLGSIKTFRQEKL